MQTCNVFRTLSSYKYRFYRFCTFNWMIIFSNVHILYCMLCFVLFCFFFSAVVCFWQLSPFRSKKHFNSRKHTHSQVVLSSFLVSVFFKNATQGQTVSSISITDTMQASPPHHFTLMGCLWLDSAQHIKLRRNDYWLPNQPCVGWGAMIWQKAQFRETLKTRLLLMQ